MKEIGFKAVKMDMECGKDFKAISIKEIGVITNAGDMEFMSG